MAKSKSDNPVVSYLQSAMNEFGKITWPTKEQAAILTAVTVVVSLLVAAYIGLSDLGFSEAYQLLLDVL